MTVRRKPWPLAVLRLDALPSPVRLLLLERPVRVVNVAPRAPGSCVVRAQDPGTGDRCARRHEPPCLADTERVLLRDHRGITPLAACALNDHRAWRIRGGCDVGSATQLERLVMHCIPAAAPHVGQATARGHS